MGENWQTVADNLPLYLSGMGVTLHLLAVSLGLGLVFAIPLGVLRALPGVASRLIGSYTYVFRGTPLLVQLFLIYYGLGQFATVRESAAWAWLQDAWFCACLAFVLNTTAYTTEIVAGAIKGLPAGELEAAKAYGMTRFTLLRRIVLPAALRRALPAYGNEAIFMLHGTSLAMLVTLVDITGAAKRVYALHYIPFEAYLTAGAFYLVLTLALLALFGWAERRFVRPLMPR